MRNTFKVKGDIVRWLTRLNIHESDIGFTTMKTVTIKNPKFLWKTMERQQAGVTYVYKGKSYLLTCQTEEVYTENLNNIQILIHSRVIGIERGIEDVEKAFAGYMAISHQNTPRAVLGCSE